MKKLILLCLAAALAGAGCVSKSTAKAQAQAAYQAGQRDALAARMAQPQVPTVTVVGNVKNRSLAWTADLTLTKALVAAEYQGATDPTQVTVTRNGQTNRIDPKRLLRGDDLRLEPGDQIDIRQ